MGCHNEPIAAAGTRAKILCFCKKVHLTLIENDPRFVYQCCCRDCCSKVEWMVQRGAPEVTKLPTPQGPVIKAICVDMFMAGFEGKKYLEAFKARESDATIMICCKECKSCVFTMGTGSQTINVNPEQCHLVGKRSYFAPLGEEQCEMRAFTHDWDKEYDPNALELPAYKGKGPTTVKGPGAMTSNFSTMKNYISAIKKPTTYSEPGVTMSAADILDDLPEPTILNLDKMSHNHCN